MQALSMSAIYGLSRKYIAYWFESRGISVKQSQAMPALIETIVLDYEEEFIAFRHNNKDSKIKALSRNQLKDALVEYIETNAEKERAAGMNKYPCQNQNLSQLRLWLKALTGSINELDVAVMAHWLWMLKRRARDLSVIHHIMPVLYGPQGCGKSVAIKKLLTPIKEYVLSSVSMDQLGDSRVALSMSQNLVIFLDELPKVNKVDMNTLKNQISTSQNSFRKLGTHIVVTAPMRVSLIGATNHSLNESLFDNTGNRRFYQIKTSDIVDHNTINNINYEALICGIDERLPTGYLTGEMLNRLKQDQIELATKDDITLFLEHFAIIPNGPVHKIDSSVLFKEYQKWAHEQGIKQAANNIWFSRRLKNSGVKSEETFEAGKKKIMWLVNENSALVPKIEEEPNQMVLSFRMNQ